MNPKKVSVVDLPIDSHPTHLRCLQAQRAAAPLRQNPLCAPLRAVQHSASIWMHCAARMEI